MPTGACINSSNKKTPSLSVSFHGVYVGSWAVWNNDFWSVLGAAEKKSSLWQKQTTKPWNSAWGIYAHCMTLSYEYICLLTKMN